MTKLYETLKADRIQAMKDRNQIAKDLLGTLVGQIDLDASRSNLKYVPKSDLHAINLIKKFLDDNSFTQSVSKDEVELIRLRAEEVILNSYLPKQLSEAELEAILIEKFGCAIKAEPKGSVMKFLKENHAGNYDGKLAAAVFDRLQ